MTHVRIEIDGIVEFDGPTSEWKRRPPEAFKDLLQPGHTPRAYMKAIMICMADAVLAQQSMDVVVTTGADKMKRDNWTMTVQHR